MLREFRAFIAKGNVLDLAVAVIIGAAFATITASLTDDIIMPVVGWLFGGLDFSSYFCVLGSIPDSFKGDPHNYAALKAAGVAVLGYGQFITVAVNFLLIAFVLFLVVRAINRLFIREQDAPPPPKPPSKEEELLAEIRDILKARA